MGAFVVGRLPHHYGGGRGSNGGSSDVRTPIMVQKLAAVHHQERKPRRYIRESTVSAAL